MMKYGEHRRVNGGIKMVPARDGRRYNVEDVDQYTHSLSQHVLSVEADLFTAREVIKNQSLEIDMLRAGALVPPAPDPDEAMLMQAFVTVFSGLSIRCGQPGYDDDAAVDEAARLSHRALDAIRARKRGG